jgi:hypothetical protein
MPKRADPTSGTVDDVVRIPPGVTDSIARPFAVVQWTVVGMPRHTCTGAAVNSLTTGGRDPHDPAHDAATSATRNEFLVIPNLLNHDLLFC